MKNALPALLFNLIVISSYSQQRDISFDAFWLRFREAVIAKDYNSLRSVTHFPLIVKGTLDSDPVKKIKADRFVYIFKHYLKQDNTTVTGNALQDIVETERIPGKEYKETVLTDFRFSDMVFKKIKGKWKLYLIYIETGYQEENNIK